jgi:hypothetical protein
VSVLAAGAALLLAGCGLNPGAAAVVGDTRISDDQVDGAASALCAANIAGAAAQGQPKPELATRGARQAALSLLIDSELSHQFGEANGIEPPRAELSTALAQNQQTIDALPEDLRDDFSELFRSYVEGQLIVQQAGREAAGAAAGPEELATAGNQQRDAWLAEEDIEVELDPRFGEYKDGGIDGSGGSLSVAVSDRAAAGDVTEPGPEWVADLPMTQKCG